MLVYWLSASLHNCWLSTHWEVHSMEFACFKKAAPGDDSDARLWRICQASVRKSKLWRHKEGSRTGVVGCDSQSLGLMLHHSELASFSAGVQLTTGWTFDGLKGLRSGQKTHGVLWNSHFNSPPFSWFKIYWRVCKLLNYLKMDSAKDSEDYSHHIWTWTWALSHGHRRSLVDIATQSAWRIGIIMEGMTPRTRKAGNQCLSHSNWYLVNFVIQKRDKRREVMGFHCQMLFTMCPSNQIPPKLGVVSSFDSKVRVSRAGRKRDCCQLLCLHLRPSHCGSMLKRLYHLESRWRNSHVLVIMAPY